MQKPAKYSIVLAVSLLALVLFFAFGLPAILRAVLVSQLEKNLHRPAAVKSVSFNPFRLRLSIRGLSVREQDNATAFVSFDLLRINVEIISLFEGGIDLSELTLVKPSVRIVRTGDNSYNFSDLLTATDKKPEQEESQPLLFSVANIMISQGRIEFDDLPKETAHQITNLGLTLPLISNFNKHLDEFIQPSFTAEINGNPVQVTGETKPFADSLETILDTAIDNVTLPQFLSYAPVKLHFKMPSGSLSAKLRLHYVQGGAKDSEIRLEGDAALRELELVTPENKPLLKLPAFVFSGITCHVDKRMLRLREISADGLRLALSREKDGSLSLQKLVAMDNATVARKQQVQPAAAEKPWSVKVDAMVCRAGGIAVSDNVPVQPVQIKLQSINFTAKNISTDNGSRAEIDFSTRIDNSSSLGMQGAFTIAPLDVNLHIDLSGLDIRPAQSYLPETLDLGLASGALWLKGAVAVKQQANAPAPAITWLGDLRLENFSAGSKKKQEELLKIAVGECREMRATTDPLALAIKTVNFEGLFLRPIVESDGTVNLIALAGEPEQPAPGPATQPQKKEPLPQISIDTLNLKKGSIQFTDKSVKPRYSSSLTEIQGSITGISSSPESRAAIDLKAKLNSYAPLTVRGSLSPLQEKLTAEVKVNFDNIDLSPFSPYSGKFIGRLVQKGRLSLDLTYRIKNDQLTSENKIFLDQFTLGKSVKSPKATSLPVGLAVSLLKNRKGEIHLDVPVSGNLDDPGFKITSSIVQVLKNLIEKAATSPFALVGAVIPGGEDLSIVKFPCGRTELGDAAKKKLDGLAGLLLEKPDLRLEIQPVAEEKEDREGLREEFMMRKLRQLKFNDLSKKERAGQTLEQTTLSKHEYEDYLREAYNAEKFEKPENMLGLSKRLPADEMKRLMLEHTKVDEEDIKEMLQQRGLAVKQYLTGQAKIPAERLLIIDARIDSGKGSDGCMVEFILK